MGWHFLEVMELLSWVEMRHPPDKDEVALQKKEVPDKKS
jgi:hypothetical protein